MSFKTPRLEIMQVYVTLFNFLFVSAVLYMHKVGVNTEMKLYNEVNALVTLN